MRAIDELDEVLNGPIVLYFDADVEQRRELLVKARTIRARERKLAELAREAYERSSQRRRMTTSWMLRYEEACKP